MPVASYWFFTLKAEGIEESQLKLSDDVVYLLFQLERGAGRTAYEHYQGLFHTRKALSMSAAKAAIGFPSIHIEQCRSAAASEYVTKEETRIGGPWERGVKVIKKKGQRTDLQAVAAALQSGKRSRDIAESHPTEFIRYGRGIERLEAIINDRPRDASVTPNIWVIIGTTGTGKTRKAWEMAEGSLYAKPVDNKWWDCYAGEKFVLFDDYVGDDSIGSAALLSIVDRYPRVVEYKGGSRQLSSCNFIFTSNVKPDKWFLNSRSWANWSDHHYAAFMRRLDEGQGEIIEM